MLSILLLVATGCGVTKGSVDPRPTPPPGTDELQVTGELAPAGRYTRTGFVPQITLELDGTWEAVQVFSGFFDIQQDAGSPDVIAVQFTRPTAVIGAGGEGQSVADAADAVATIGDNDRLTVIETSDSVIDGLEGHQVTVENAGTGHASVMSVAAGTFGIDPGRRLWIAFFDTHDGLMAIQVGGSVDQWDEALAAAEPVLESVTIGR